VIDSGARLLQASVQNRATNHRPSSSMPEKVLPSAAVRVPSSTLVPAIDSVIFKTGRPRH
jgi:hypothetical protein